MEIALLLVLFHLYVTDRLYYPWGQIDLFTQIYSNGKMTEKSSRAFAALDSIPVICRHCYRKREAHYAQ